MPRRSVNLRAFPLSLQYLIAVLVSALVMFAAWHIGHRRPAPGWLGPTMAVWVWLGPGLLAFFAVKAFLRRMRPVAAPNDSETPPRRDS